MKELVIISGKGGTGKTSITAAFAALAQQSVLADCDVDAADLHLVLKPTIQKRTTFTSGRVAHIREADCTECGLCERLCRFDSIKNFKVNPLRCEGCGVCVEFCPVKAIDFPEEDCGEWFISETRFGNMVHARMQPGAENSGKLVTVVREAARKLAKHNDSTWLLVDGPPGIGCPVIASITGADAVLAVSEPTLSGEHDLKRVLELARFFNIPCLTCINKWDINPAMTERIETLAKSLGAKPVGRVPYDRAVTAAQINARSLVEESDGPASDAVRELWNNVCTTLL